MSFPPPSGSPDTRPPSPDLPSPGWAPDPLSQFPAESGMSGRAIQLLRNRYFLPSIAIVLAVLLLFAWMVRRGGNGGGAVAEGRVVIHTVPEGADVLEDGRLLGTTPLALTLGAGRHPVVLQHDGASRELVLDVTAGTEVVHHVELRQAPAAGSVRVETLPAGAEVLLDGHVRGRSPIELSGVEPGEHEVMIRHQGTTWSRRVAVGAGGTASIVVPLGPTSDGPAAGWLAVSSPVELQLYEGDSLIGSSRMERVMLRSGEHRLRLVNEQLGFETSTTVRIAAGSVSRLPVKLPNGTISVNAVPWAEVFIDGQPVGQTPIANHALPLGPHEVILRNPKFAEQRRSVTISLKTPTRIGVDLRQ